MNLYISQVLVTFSHFHRSFSSVSLQYLCCTFYTEADDDLLLLQDFERGEVENLLALLYTGECRLYQRSLPNLGKAQTVGQLVFGSRIQEGKI